MSIHRDTRDMGIEGSKKKSVWPKMRMRKLEHIGFRNWAAWVCDLNGFNDLVRVYGNSRRDVEERCASIVSLSGKEME